MRKTLFGCTIDALTMDETLDRIEGFIASGQPHQHVVVNVNKLVKADREPALRELINSCDLINCDGMPVVWASRLLGKSLPERVAGIDLFQRLVERAAARGWPVFFLGARDEVVTKVKGILSSQYPQLKVAGYRHGYWSAEEEAGVVDLVRDAVPDILFVAISSPKKEQFLARYLDTMGVPFVMGVGGTFDVVAGLTRRAPRWMQQSGLEWFYRFLQEPGRLFGRYFVEGLGFAGLIWRELRASRRRRS